MKMKLNLSRKIALAVATIILILCLVIGLMSVATSRKSLLKETEKTLAQLSQEGSKYVELSIENYTNILEGFSKRESITNMDFESIDDSLKEEIKELGYEDVALVTPDRQARYIIEDSTVDISDGRNVSIEEAFKGNVSVSDVTISDTTGELSVLYTIPVRNNGEVVGVLSGRAPGSDLNLITDEMKFGDEGYAFIMDNDGVFYAHPNDELVLSQRSALEEESFKDFASSLSKLGEERTGLIEYKINNVDNYAYINPISVNDWNIAIVIPKAEALSSLKSLQYIIFFITIIMIILGVIAALFLGRYISNPIIAISNMIERFANYDLRFDKEDTTAVKLLNRSDEIGTIANALQTMQSNLVSIITDISNASGQLASSSEELNATTDQSSSASNEVARAIEDIAHGATEQARDTENGAVGIQELGDQITSTQDGIESLYESSNEINGLKDEGLEVIHDLITKTDRSNETTKEIHQVINETNDSAQKINSASEMIRSIAEQTNLLALNAAIEAARAGESGKGFAVVAEEIRVLAEESSSFTGEISNVIDELIGKTKDSLSTMKEMSEIATSQTESVNITNNKFEGIAEAIENMNSLMNEIHDSGQSMEDKKDEIVTLVENLSAISEENAAGTEEASASVEEQSASIIEIANSSESLAKLAENMNEIISKFKY